MKACLCSTSMCCLRETIIGLIPIEQDEKSTQIINDNILILFYLLYLSYYLARSIVILGEDILFYLSM